jgi:hypothetical protein
MKKILFVVIISFLFSIGAPSFADTPNLSDTESAKIDLVTLSNRNIEVSNVSSVLLATITASDNLNNIAEVYFAVYRAANPFPTQVNLFPIQSSTKPISTSVINNRVVSIFQFKITIPKGLASGDYYIYSFARDAAGNYPQTGLCDKYCSPAEMPKLPESTFTIKNDLTGQVIDVTPFDISTQIQTLQNKYDSLISSSTALTSTYDSLLTSKAKVEAELKTSLALRAESDSKYRAAEEAKQIVIIEAASLRNLVGTLKTDLSSLQAQLSAANKKLTLICKAKPKPKGC